MRKLASLLHGRELRHYLAGHAGILLGAWATGATGSMWPLALGASASLLTTVPLVQRIRAAARERARTRIAVRP